MSLNLRGKTLDLILFSKFLPGFAKVDIGDGMFAIGFKQVGCG